MTEKKEVQSKVNMLLICWFVGFFGVHRFMMGYKNWWIQLITLGGFFVWSFNDLMKISTGSMKMADGRELK